METVSIHRAYRFRLEPTARQEQQLRQFAGARRFVWNWALAEWKTYYRQTGKSIPRRELSARLTTLKRQPETMWLAHMHAQALQQVLADLHCAYSNYFDHRAKLPRFKDRKREQARFRMPQKVRLIGQHVSIPKIGLVRLRLSRLVEGQPKSATFKQDARGHWHVTLVAQMQMPLVPLSLPDPTQSVGLDLGLKDTVVSSDGQKIPAPRFYRRAQRTLRRAQRTHSRRQRGSHNKAKARARVARLHHHVASQRADFTHKLTTKLVQQHQAVCIENLNVKGLARTKLAKSFYDAALGELRRQLLYKGQWYHTHVVVIDRFYPSTQLCHVCDFKNTELTLADRTWHCPICETTHDRDINAALNVKKEGLRILAVGHTESLNACGADVRPPIGGRL